MNVTIVTLGCYPSTGGPSKSIAAFQRALGAKVVAWVDPRDAAAEKLVFPADAVVPSVASPFLRTLLYPQRDSLDAAEALVASSDLVSSHLFWRWHCRWVQSVASRHRLPFWLVPHGGLDPYVFQSDTALKHVFARTVTRRFLRDAAAVVCSTRREHEKLKHWLPRALPAILPWPLDESDIRPRNDAARLAARSRLGIPPDARCLLFLGRLHPMKRPLETITALARSQARNVHLVIVGNEHGVTIADCIARAKKDNVADRVHAVGPVYGGAKHDYFDACDAYISLSHRENFNFSATESMGSGLPVILSPGNDLAADLQKVDCGWMLHDISAAHEAIAAVAAAPESLLQARGDRGREWAQAHLRFDRFKAALTAYAERIVESRYAPAATRAKGRDQ